jgi:hypothetical protein
MKFFFFLQGKAPKHIHDILKETLGKHAPSKRMPPWKTGWTSSNVVISPPVMLLVVNDPNSEHHGEY